MGTDLILTRRTFVGGMLAAIGSQAIDSRVVRSIGGATDSVVRPVANRKDPGSGLWVIDGHVRDMSLRTDPVDITTRDSDWREWIPGLASIELRFIPVGEIMMDMNTIEEWAAAGHPASLVLGKWR